MTKGLENTEVVCLSFYGCIRNGVKRQLALDAIKYTVSNLKSLKTIYIYTTSNNDKLIHKFIDHLCPNINIVIPNNTLRLRNKKKQGGDLNG